jgi:hypothetical protein
MRKLFVISCWLLAISSQLAARPAPRAVQARNAQLTIDWLTGRLWVREATGRNDGPGVADIIRAGGGVPAQRPEWCGFTQAAANRAHKLPIPRNGMQGAATAWFPLTGPDAERTLFHRAARVGSIDSIRLGLQAGFDYGRGIHHVAKVAKLGRAVRPGRAPRNVYTLAGNEGSGTNAALKLTLYPIGSIDALGNWLY